MTRVKSRPGEIFKWEGEGRGRGQQGFQQAANPVRGTKGSLSDGPKHGF